jgi:sec-independent protein translocase protein TatB
MLEIGWTEMLVIAIVMIVVVGPKDLPSMLRTFGRTTAKMRSMAGDFRKQFDEALKEAELDDLKTLAGDARKLNPASEIRKALSPMEKAAQDVRAGLDSAMNPTKPAAAKPATDEAKPAEPAKAGAAAIPGDGASASKANGATKPASAVPPSKSASAGKPAGGKGGKATPKPAAANAAPKQRPAAAKAAPKPKPAAAKATTGAKAKASASKGGKSS